MHTTIDPVQEQHYNVRARVPDFLDVFQQWAVRSRTYLETAHAKRDLRYGQAAKSTLDIFLPEGKSNRTELLPVHLFIHGGYWQALDKSDFSYIADPFTNAGVACVILNYDLCPDVALGEIVAQVKEAIVWLWENGESHGLDPDNIHISGHSAGGHLVAELLSHDWEAIPGHHVPNHVIKSCVAISGLYDLKPLIHTTINTNLGLDFETASHLSPLFRKTIVSCPVYLLYGGWEGEGFEQQSARFADHLRSQNIPCELARLDNATHFDAVNSLAEAQSAVFQWAMSQMNSF